MSTRILLFLMLGVDALVLLYEVSTLSIASYEARVVFLDNTFLHYIVQASLYLFGENDYALRVPMIIIHLLSALLLFKVSKPYVKRDSDRLWLVLVFILLPGVTSSALLVNCAGVMILILFGLLYLYQIKSPLIPFVLVTLLAINGAFIWLYLALFVYAFKKGNTFYMAFTALLFATAYYIYGFDTTGRPSGHFLDTLALYASIFSPVVFIFMVYTLYRKMVTKAYDITLHVGGVVFIVSLLLSFRQQIPVEDFAPYLMVLLPLSAQTFFSSYRVRLRMFRRRYRLMLTIGLGILVIHFFILLFSQSIYLILENPHKHFVYDNNIVKELATALKKENVSCVAAESDEMQLRLRFYNINYCESRLLYEVPRDIDSDVTISYFGKKVAAFNVTKSPI